MFQIKCLKISSIFRFFMKLGLFLAYNRKERWTILVKTGDVLAEPFPYNKISIKIAQPHSLLISIQIFDPFKTNLPNFNIYTVFLSNLKRERECFLLFVAMRHCVPTRTFLCVPDSSAFTVPDCLHDRF